MGIGRQPDARTSIYDEVAFPSYSYPQSHPERLATIARLCGMRPAQTEPCRVLEIGCGAGGNLLPMAASLPGSEFLGIDLSPQQIALGQSQLEAAALTNVRLEARDLQSLDATEGKFDYLIAHGVLSWTSAPVQDRLLRLCQELLAANGVAYINYNTYPGWHVQGMLRDMLYYHSQSFAKPEDQVVQARQMMQFLQQALPDSSTPLGQLVRSELDAIRQNSDPYLFHAYLNVVNRPFYVSEFQQRVAAHGLSYVGDADPETTWPDITNPQLATQLSRLAPDPTRWPQYFDFVRFTNSRRSLVCHADVKLDRGPTLAVVARLHVSSSLRPAGDAGSPRANSFRTSDNRTVSTNDPRLQATLQALAEAWPGSLSADELFQSVDRAVPGAFNGNAAAIERWYEDLVRGFCQRVLNLNVLPNRCAKSVPTHPRVSPHVRVQTTAGDFVTNQQHETVRLNEFERQCARLLDGSRTVAELSQQLGVDVQKSLDRFLRSALLVDG